MTDNELNDLSSKISAIKDRMFLCVAIAAKGLTEEDFKRMDSKGLGIDRDLIAQSRDHYQKRLNNEQ